MWATRSRCKQISLVTSRQLRVRCKGSTVRSMVLHGASLAQQLLKIPHLLFCPIRIFSRRSLTTRKYGEEPKDRWNYNPDPFNGKVSDEQKNLPFVDSNKLENEVKPPIGVKMLVRDFIEDSLYNPNYGYFPKQAKIFNTQDFTFDFPRLRDSAEFQEAVASKYAAYGADRHDGPGRQLWHTPTELFKVCLHLFVGITLTGQDP